MKTKTKEIQRIKLKKTMLHGIIWSGEGSSWQQELDGLTFKFSSTPRKNHYIYLDLEPQLAQLQKK